MIAEETSFAPGSTPVFETDFLAIDRRAYDEGRALGDRLCTLPPAHGRLEGLDTEVLREKALNHPRFRAFLGARDEDSTQAGKDEPQRYNGAQVFLFASFSIPKASLKKMMREAERFGVPFVFRGFVENSVYSTHAAIEETFGAGEHSVGYSIDLTLFTRFGVNAVTVVIVATEPVDVCEIRGCREESAPAHDRVSETVPLEFTATRGEADREATANLLAKDGSSE